MKTLHQLILERAITFGSFPLASGKISNYYINSKKILFHPEAITLIGQAFAKQLIEWDVQGVGGLEIGAIPLTTSCILAAYHQGKHLEGFFVRKTAKTHGTKDRIEGIVPSKVAIIDDVLTTGKSALAAVEEVEKIAKIIGVMCIVDRLEGAQDLFSKYQYKSLFTINDFGINNDKS